MLFLGNVSEKLKPQATAGIFPLLPYTIKFEKNPRSSSTGGLCQILLPCSLKATKPQLPALAMPTPPSMKLQTQGQMANSNVPFCASFQMALARPDGILCLPGINYNLQVATALPRGITSTSFPAHSFPNLGCPFPDDGYLLEIYQRGKKSHGKHHYGNNSSESKSSDVVTRSADKALARTEQEKLKCLSL